MMIKSQLTCSQLPDLVHDCEEQLQMNSSKDQAMKLTCKQIAHSLRIVADQVDQKYCQVSAHHHLLEFLDSFPFLYFLEHRIQSKSSLFISTSSMAIVLLYIVDTFIITLYSSVLQRPIILLLNIATEYYHRVFSHLL